MPALILRQVKEDLRKLGAEIYAPFSPAIERLNNQPAERFNVSSDGKRFTCSFIEPGFVNYADCGGGMERLRKEVIAECLNSIIGAPLTIGHVSTKVRVNKEHGEVDAARYNSESGWFDCEGPCHTDAARNALRRGMKPSVGFVVEEFGEGGRDHNIAFDADHKRIRFHHLAIVDNPRYSQAKIRLNAVQPKTGDTPMFKWLKSITRKKADGTGDETVQESTDLAPESTIEIDGKTVRMNELVDAHTAKTAKDEADAKEAKRIKDEADAAATRTNEITPDAVIDLGGGKTAKLSELIESHKTRETPEQKTARENAIKAKGTQSFRLLAEASQTSAEKDSTPFVDTSSTEAQLKRGRELFGSTN